MKENYYPFVVIGIFTILISMIIAINYSIDCMGIYHNKSNVLHQEIKIYIQKLLKDGKALKQLPYERLVKMELVKQAEAECYVVGSSRIMQVNFTNSEYIRKQCGSLLNLGVSGAGFQDILSFAGVIYNKNAPKKVFIDISPWSLRYDEKKLWMEYEDDYYSARQIILDEPRFHENIIKRVKNFNGEKFKNLINGEYLMKNIKNYSISFIQSAELINSFSTDNFSESDAITLPDGSHIYSKLYEKNTPQPVAEVADGGYKIGDPFVQYEIDRDLRILIKKFQEKGIEIVFILAPYHPKVWLCSSKGACAAMITVEQYVKKLSEKYQIKILGSYHPEPYKLTWEDFHDAIHLSYKSLSKLM